MFGQRCIVCYAYWFGVRGGWACKHRRGCPNGITKKNQVQYIERGSWSMRSYGTAGNNLPVPWAQSTPCFCLGVPTHSKDCPGRNGVILNPSEWVGIKLIEDYRIELDRVVDALLDRQGNLEQLRGQALAYAWCIAKMQNQVEPNIDSVRKEAMRRREIRLSSRNGNVKSKRKVAA